MILDREVRFMDGKAAIVQYKEWYQEFYGVKPTEKLIETFCKIKGIEIEQVREQPEEENDITNAEDEIMMKHSPLPWKADYFDAGTGGSEKLCIYRKTEDSIMVQTIAIVEQPNIDHYIAGDNAVFIIEACNNYEALQTNYNNLLGEYEKACAAIQSLRAELTVKQDG